MAPAVKPRMRYFRTNIEKTTTGNITMVPPAAILPRAPQPLLMKITTRQAGKTIARELARRILCALGLGNKQKKVRINFIIFLRS